MIDSKLDTPPMTDDTTDTSNPTQNPKQSDDEQTKRRILEFVCSATDEGTPVYPAKWERGEDSAGGYGNHFAWHGGTVNTDLARIAEAEGAGKIHIKNGGSNDYEDLLLSPMHRLLCQQFIEEGMSPGGEQSFMHAILRAYLAGRYSPNRLTFEEAEGPETLTGAGQRSTT